MSGNGRRLIAREGIPFLLSALILTITGYIFLGVFVASLFALLLLSCAFYFRDPVCELPSAPLAVLCPVSGRIDSIELTQDPWLERNSYKIRISMGLWDAHGLRSPIEGKVMKQWSTVDKDSQSARQYAYWIKTDEDDDLVMSLNITRSLSYVEMTMVTGERSGQGQRCGYIYPSGDIDIFLPDSAKLTVETGNHVMAGSDILGQFVRN